MSNSPEVVVITGASAGVGRATVRKFARHSCACRDARVREPMDWKLQQRRSNNGAIARVEYAAIRLGKEPVAAQSATRSADISAGSRRRSDLLRGAASAP